MKKLNFLSYESIFYALFLHKSIRGQVPMLFQDMLHAIQTIFSDLDNGKHSEQLQKWNPLPTCFLPPK